jgi:hypothetical protein
MALEDKTEQEIKSLVEQGDQDAINLRIEAGRQAALNDSSNGEISIDEKPSGQTSEEVYPYTYYWVQGYNSQVSEM